VGAAALLLNTASGSTAVGASALQSNSTGPGNTAVGFHALMANTTNGGSTATGYEALANSTGFGNTAVGYQALINNTTGNSNIALGAGAGSNLPSGSNNIYIGNSPGNSAGESNTIAISSLMQAPSGEARCLIGGIYFQSVNNGVPVLISSSNQLGTQSSSKRFKKDIGTMDKASEAIFSLRPVTFYYKSDDTSTPQFGLVAEEVAEVNPDLVVRDKDGEIYSVRYDAVNAMLLNEFLKEHKKLEKQRANTEKQQAAISQQDRKIQEQDATIAELRRAMQVLTAQLKAQAAQIQKVSAQLELRKPTQQAIASGR
jgi:hypothetical protein